MAAIMAYKASAGEASEASGALSNSTGASPSHALGGGAAAVTSGHPGAPAWHGALVGGGGAGDVLHGASSGGSGGYVSGGGYASGGHGSQWTAAGSSRGGDGGGDLGPLSAAPSLVAPSDGGSCDTAIAYVGELHECLLCGLHTCFPSGPATIE